MNFIKTKKILARKILTVIFVAGICFSSTFAPFARADIWTGTDWANLVKNTTTAIESKSGTIMQTKTFAWDTFGKNALDYAAYAAAQKLLTQLTNSTVKWIQGGFHGKPSFAVDTKKIATEIADNIAGELVLKIRNLAVCEFTTTYKDDLVKATQIESKTRPYTYDMKAKCPFKENLEFKASEFYAGLNTFTWDAFGSALQDGGSAYSVKTLTAQEKANREATAKAEKDKKQSWSNGFADIKNMKDCNYPPELYAQAGDPSPEGTDNCEIPATETAGFETGQTQKCLTQAQAQQINTERFSDPVNAKAFQEAYCPTTTPGKIVGDQLTKTLGVDMDRIGFADNMNKIISAFLDMVMQKTVRGVFGTGDSSHSSGPIGGSFGTGGTSSLEAVVTTGGANVGGSPTRGMYKASLNGTLTFNGDPTNATVWFRYSPESFSKDDLAKQTIDLSPSGGDGVVQGETQPQTFYATTGDLLPGTTYYFNANMSSPVAPSSPDNWYGEVMTFTTSANPAN